MPSTQAGLSLIFSCSVLTIMTVNIWPATINRPPRIADFLGSIYLIISPGIIPKRAEAFNMKSNQSKISSRILYLSLMKSKYLKAERLGNWLD